MSNDERSSAARDEQPSNILLVDPLTETFVKDIALMALQPKNDIEPRDNNPSVLKLLMFFPKRSDAEIQPS